MLKSMTGFGRSEILEQDRKVIVEIKSVNHRYFDVSMKMPKKFNQFESRFRKILQEYCSRGKLDVYMVYEDLSKENYSLSYNEKIAKQYVECLEKMSRDFHISNDLTVTQLSHFPDVLMMEEKEEDMEALAVFIEKALREAAQQFMESKLREGASLKEDLDHKLDYLTDIVAYIEERSPQIIEEYQKHLEEKVADFLKDTSIDTNRILAEVTVFADKSCVDEELVRLKSHITTMKETLHKGECIGRKLDFIVQEMNREANTILSKTTDLDISNKGIALKTEIEKIREQIQNIE